MTLKSEINGAVLTLTLRTEARNAQFEMREA